jgi:AAA+ ATPase superfamily predicted ATPase
MNINLLFEIILILFAILASNGIIYSLTFLNKPNSSENISVITNSLEKDGLALTSLIASNHIRLTSSESSTSQTLSVTSSESSSSQTLSVSSSETNVSENLSVSSSETNVSENIFDSENSYLSNTNEENLLSNVEMSDNFTSLDSLTILDTQSYEQWREIVTDLHEMPINSPAGLLQQIKFEELNILYSQDIIHFAITQTELRLIIEHLPAISLFKPEINHLILTMMSYYHG